MLQANIFVHYKPLEYDERVERFQESLNKGDSVSVAREKARPIASVRGQKVGGHEQDNHDEETLKRHMADIDREEEEKLSMSKNELKEGRLLAPGRQGEGNVPDGRTALHEAASRGDFDSVEKLLQNQNTEMLHARDENGWQAIHEAARAGSLEVLQ